MKKVLLVDDDRLTIEFMKLCLESDGHSTLSAYSLDEARASVEQNNPHIIVTDIELSDGSGVDLAQYAKSKGNPRVIGVTGYSAEQLQDAGHDSTVFDLILTKPIEIEDLKQAIAS